MSSPAQALHPFLIDYPMKRVVRAYPLGAIRAYCVIRSHILRQRILAEIGQYIPYQGDILELGCGFGLFANCFALSRPGAHFHGVDLSGTRIAQAQAAAAQCGIGNVSFACHDARETFADLPAKDCIYLLDLVHHLPPGSVAQFLGDCWRCVKPGGRLLIKDVSDRPFHKMAFTWMLDVLMTGGEFPNYLSPEYFLKQLTALGAQVSAHTLDDYLPYPHMLYVCTKPL